MFTITRLPENPILTSNEQNSWEKEAVFNGCPAVYNNKIYLLYRALSQKQYLGSIELKLSTIGSAQSSDGIHFSSRTQFIKPEFPWERFGCEDPRVTLFEGKYYIFYTALSNFPFNADSIKIALAKTTDFNKVSEKHPVTTFNSKAMALFPERVNGKIVAVLTANTDKPPASIALAFFDKEEELWSAPFWQNWYSKLSAHVLFLQRTPYDHIEAGAPPLKTDYGWLLLYSYIKNYFRPPAVFTVEAVLLDLDDPSQIIAHTDEPLLFPTEEYEKYGSVPNIVFPSGALLKNNLLYIYYGAADTVVAAASLRLNDLLKELLSQKRRRNKLNRFPYNPIIEPIPQHPWESKATFNPAALYLNKKVHLLYRAMSNDDTSVLGYAATKDGYHIEERLNQPVFTPRFDFEKKLTSFGNSGCEDPRLTQIDDTLYMCYTAYDGKNPPRVALTSINIADFLAKRWHWKTPVLISPPSVDDKDACLLPKKIKGHYVIFHRLNNNICLSHEPDLFFDGQSRWLKIDASISPRNNKWDNHKIGIGPPPIETSDGWLLIYHGVSDPGHIYKVGALLLKSVDPSTVIARTDYPIFEPVAIYEREGIVANVVFPCGAVIINNHLLVYYGAADRVIGVASIGLPQLLEKLV